MSSTAHAQVESYLIDQLQAFGMQTEVQEATSLRELPEYGQPEVVGGGRVRNIVARVLGEAAFGGSGALGGIDELLVCQDGNFPVLHVSAELLIGLLALVSGVGLGMLAYSSKASGACTQRSRIIRTVCPPSSSSRRVLPTRCRFFDFADPTIISRSVAIPPVLDTVVWEPMT